MMESMNHNIMRVTSCSCVSPQYPCLACGAGMRQQQYTPLPLPTVSMITLTSAQLEDIIARAVERALRQRKRQRRRNT